jgi:SsrA-binding protein
MKVINKKARFEYDIYETIETGIVLTGSEAKSARLGQVDLGQAHVKIMGSEAQVINMHVYPYQHDSTDAFEPTRTRKLLLNKRELVSLANKTQAKGLTIIPTALYTKGPKVKLEIALARGKKTYQKREAIKMADLDRDMERELRPKDRP